MSMETNMWWTEFGFTKNPYGTGALFSDEGDSLLVGRDNETNHLSQLLVSQGRETPKIAILAGDNGVGKTSIVNVVIYRLQKNNPNYLFLKIKPNSLLDKDTFTRELYTGIIEELLRHTRFLIKQKVNFLELFYVWFILHFFVLPKASIGNIDVELNQNLSAIQHLSNIAEKWLKKCFRESGRLICFIDNLETKGTPSAVSDFLDKSRDSIFAIEGLSWVLCGTPQVIEPALKKRRLDGYLSVLEIQPISEIIAPDIVQTRIELFSGEHAVVPVDSVLFRFIYVNVTKNHLRIALSLCDEFAFYLFENQERVKKDRTEELKIWLAQIAGRIVLPDLSDESWNLFGFLLNTLNGECTSGDAWITGLSNSNDLRIAAEPLSACGLVSIEETYSGFVIRSTRNGFLVNFLREKSD
ncbi:MAG: AAA family ATPase [Oscillospiraceae bacterium]|nr:AAA family ATPase [Oscillospiraceae bacterium]